MFMKHLMMDTAHPKTYKNSSFHYISNTEFFVYIKIVKMKMNTVS